MMTEKQFAASQKECAEMLGMTLTEYQEYCKNLKVSPQIEQPDKQNDKSADDLLKS